MRFALPILAIAAAACAADAQVAQHGDVAALDWLSGHWVRSDGESWTEENWVAPRAGVLLGVNRSGDGDALLGFEFLRVARDADGTISFFASPAGRPPTAFLLVAQEGRSVTFENPEHDYPQRIRYWREGDTLHAEISGERGANPMTWAFRRQAGNGN